MTTIRKISNWSIVTNGEKFGLAFRKKVSDEDWYDTIHEAERKLLDILEDFAVLIDTPLNQSEVAKLLEKLTKKRWDRKKVHLYLKREVIPNPDEYDDMGRPLWLPYTIIQFASKEKKDH